MQGSDPIYTEVLTQELLKFFIVDFVVSFVLTAIFLKLMISVAKKKNMTQTIREDGPQAHLVKAGTPTMGGVAYIGGVLATLGFLMPTISRSVMFETSEFFTTFFIVDLAYLLLFCFSFFLMGFLDDYLNINKTRYLGIRPLHKFILQFVIASLFSFLVLAMREVLFVSMKNLLYSVFWVVVLVGTVNAVNITDGLDGLAAGCVSLCFIPFLIYSIVQQQWGVTFFILMILGCTTAFLLFNVHPAKIFMGNCGSMGLGAALAAVAIVLHKEFMLLVCGAVFVIETLSVMIQVAYFKSTKKRIFKMAPIHHHFELSGYKETQITRGLWLAGLASCVLGAWVFKVLEFGF